MKRIFTVAQGLAMALALSACASVTPLPVANQTQEQVNVTIYRSGQLQGSLTDTYIGWNNHYYTALGPKEMTHLTVPAGLQTFKIRAHADWSNKLSVDLQPGKEVCLMAEVNPQNIVGLNWFVSGYQLRQVACLDANAQQTYTLVAN